MKHVIAFIAVILLTAAAPTYLAHGKTRDMTFSDVSNAQEMTATTERSKRVTPRKKRRARPRCRRVVTTLPKGDAITTSTGLTYIVTRRSTERQPQPGETVSVNYTGLLGSGVKFDSSLDRGKPIEFPLGMGRVIKGWDEGIAKLRIGEQATLIIPPNLGYGDRGAGGVIPPNATLIFLVELVGIKETSKTTP